MPPSLPVTTYRSPWSWVRSTVVNWRKPGGTVVVVVVGGAVVVVVVGGAVVVVVVGAAVIVVARVGGVARRVRRGAVVVVAMDRCTVVLGAAAVCPAVLRQATLTVTAAITRAAVTRRSRQRFTPHGFDRSR